MSEALKFNPCVHADAPEWVQRPQTRHLFGPVAQELSALLKESYVEDSDTFQFDCSPESCCGDSRWFHGLRWGRGLARLCLSPCSWALTGTCFPCLVDFTALRPPGRLLQWHCGVRVSSNRKLVGLLSAIPANIRISDRYIVKHDRVSFDVLIDQELQL